MMILITCKIRQMRLLISIIISFCCGLLNCSQFNWEFVFTMTEGPVDIFCNHVTVNDAYNLNILNENLYKNSTIFEKRIAQEIENVITPTLMQESWFSSWVRNRIRNHQLIPRIIPSKNILDSSMKIWKKKQPQLDKKIGNEVVKNPSDLKKNFINSNEFSHNISKIITKKINKKTTELIDKYLVPNYFLLDKHYNKIYEDYINADEDNTPQMTINFFNKHNFKVESNKRKIGDLHIAEWNVKNNDITYIVFDIPHINIMEFNKWISSITFKNQALHQYILLFRLPINAEQLSDDDQKIKITQIKNLVEKIEQSGNSVHQLSITGGFSYDMIQLIKEENIHINIHKIYTTDKTLQNLYNSLKKKNSTLIKKKRCYIKNY